mgnify:CR=1 FL=1
MPQIYIIDENPTSRKNLEERLRREGFPVVAVASLEQLVPSNGQSAAARPLKLRELERLAIEEALRQTNGNRTHAARQLGISLRKLQYRLKEYGLNLPAPSPGAQRESWQAGKLTGSH